MPAIVPNKGGIGRVTGILADELEKRGNRCFYLALLRENVDEANGVRQFYLPRPEESRFSCEENQRYYEFLLTSKKVDVVVFQCSFKKFPFKKFVGHPPLIFVLHNNPCEYVAFVQDKLRGRAFSRHVLAPLKIFFRRRNFSKIARWNYALADRYILLSDSFKRGFIDHLYSYRDEGKLIAIYNPCSFSFGGEDLDMEGKEQIILFVGRLNIVPKRPDLFLRVWSLVEAEFPCWRVEILGDGNDTEKLKSLATELGLSRVRFRGTVNPKPFYKKASILCVTSSTEGFPMVSVEAMSQGCVPVAFNSFSAAEEIIDSEHNGFLVPPFDLEKYASTLRYLMCDSQNRRIIALHAIEKASLFEIGKIGDKWCALFQELCAPKNC